MVYHTHLGCSPHKARERFTGCSTKAKQHGHHLSHHLQEVLCRSSLFIWTLLPLIPHPKAPFTDWKQILLRRLPEPVCFPSLYTRMLSRQVRGCLNSRAPGIGQGGPDTLKPLQVGSRQLGYLGGLCESTPLCDCNSFVDVSICGGGWRRVEPHH